jgi:CheY-like chemotaxis protein
MTNEKPPILLVEDNEDDIFLMERVLKKAGIAWPLQIVTDGQQALDYLRGAGSYTDRAKHPLPAVVFLDLKLPYVHGFDVLAWMRSEPAFKETAVFVLTSSPEERDRRKAEQLGARAYLVKPPTRQMVLSAMQLLEEPGAATPVSA